MCGRTVFTLNRNRVTRVSSVRDSSRLPTDLSQVVSYNLCPTRNIACVLDDPETHERCVKLMKWSLEPRFPTTHALTTINARIEGIKTSKVYSPLIDSRRCVVIVDAFYEWDQRTKQHTPFLIRFGDHVKEESIPTSSASSSQSDIVDEQEDPTVKRVLQPGVAPLLMAALYDVNPSTNEYSCSILTADSSGPVSKVHTRMPVLLSPSTAQLWLGQSKFDEVCAPVMKTLRVLAQELITVQVSPLVNSVANKSYDVTLPATEVKKRSFEQGLGRFFSLSPKKEDQTDHESKKQKI